MRNLTVTRRKAYAGCLVKVKIYTEDPIGGDTQIDGVKCRLLGKLKNGESKTFSVDTCPMKIYAIYDQLSKGFCSDRYILPAGEEDVSVSGKSRFAPFSGNPFYFDGVTDSVTLAGRKEHKAIGAVIFTVCVVAGVVAGVIVGLNIF